MNIPLNDLKRPFMTTLFSNRYVDALAKTIFLFAATHLLILAFIAFRESIHVLNVFTILNLDAFLPWLGQGMISFFLSYGMAVGVYGLVFFLLTNRAKKTGNKRIRESASRAASRRSTPQMPSPTIKNNENVGKSTQQIAAQWNDAHSTELIVLNASQEPEP